MLLWGFCENPRVHKDREVTLLCLAEGAGNSFLLGCFPHQHCLLPSQRTPSDSQRALYTSQHTWDEQMLSALGLPQRPYLMDGRCLMTTSRAWIVSKGTLGRRPESASCKACRLTQDTHLMDTLKIRSLPSPGSVTSSSTCTGSQAHSHSLLKSQSGQLAVGSSQTTRPRHSL